MVDQEIKPECIEWDDLGKCVKWKKTPEGKIIADFRGCELHPDKKGKVIDEFMQRVRKGIEIKE